MLLLDVGIHISGVDATQEINVFVRVELRHLAFRRWFGTLMIGERRYSMGLMERYRFKTHEYLHFLVQPVIHDQRMAHPYTRRLHANAR